MTLALIGGVLAAKVRHFRAEVRVPRAALAEQLT